MSFAASIGCSHRLNTLILRELTNARDCMAKLSKRGTIRRTLRYQKDKRSIEGAKSNLAHAFSRFNVGIVRCPLSPSRSDSFAQLANSIMLQQEVRAGFAVVSASTAELRTELRSLRTELRHKNQRGRAHGPDKIGVVEMLVMQKAVHVTAAFFF